MARFAFPKLFLATLLVVVYEGRLFAHPGHAVEVVAAESPLHYVMQPEHGLALAAFAAAMWFVSRCSASAKRSPRLQ